MAKIELELQLGAFQGPFDLLLHLIRSMKVDIHDISMLEITTQYLAFIQEMQALELDIASEYLVMASTLLEIKARMLLPVEPVENLEGEYEGDPREILIQQLLLYQQFQDVAAELSQRESDRAKHFGRPETDLSAYQTKVPLVRGQVSLSHLVLAMQEVLQAHLDRQPKEKAIQTEPMTVSQKIQVIQERLSQGKRITFYEMLESGNREDIITTFMAMLELVRKQEVIFYQEKALGPIMLEGVDR